MEFIVLQRENIYYIAIPLYDVDISADRFLARMLDMSYGDYSSLIISYGASLTSSWRLAFYDEHLAQRFADHLNEKYLVLLRLRGIIL